MRIISSEHKQIKKKLKALFDPESKSYIWKDNDC